MATIAQFAHRQFLFLYSKICVQNLSTEWQQHGNYIHVHLDINNLANFPNMHQIPIVLQWEEAIIVRGEARGIQLKTFIKTLTDNL